MYVALDYPELAILFYKQSFNLIFDIGEDIPAGLQQSYATTNTSTLRTLAALLLEEGRVVEAQQVLDLVAPQEALSVSSQYLRNSGNTYLTRIDLLLEESKVLEDYEEILSITQEIVSLNYMPEEDFTPSQTTRLNNLREALKKMKQEFRLRLSRHESLRNDFFENKSEILKQSSSTSNVISESSEITILETLEAVPSRNFRDIPEKTALIYPLILEDKLHLVVATSNEVLNVMVNISSLELSRIIFELRQALENPYSEINDIQFFSKQLYDLLIGPIEEILYDKDIEKILFAPDRQLRYIPLAALHDGDSWLIERFNINYISSLSSTDLSESSSPFSTSSAVLAGALEKGEFSVQIGNETFGFSELPHASSEVELISKIIPNTTILLGEAFTPRSTFMNANSYSILHLATHVVVSTDGPEYSFILFGNGETLNLREVDLLNLSNVDLIVLSGSESLIGDQLADGVEILGFSYQFLRAGVKSLVASLWNVSDGGTQVLFTDFYSALLGGDTSTSEALREAQLTLINNQDDLSHPYYWAPFIIFGDGF